MSEDKIVKTGIFIYDGIAEGTIQIFEKSCRPGSGDPEDTEEWCEDQFGTFFEVRYRLPTIGITSKAGGGYYKSLKEAIDRVELSCEKVRWDP
jgi:hypothetical protein